MIVLCVNIINTSLISGKSQTYSWSFVHHHRAELKIVRKDEKESLIVISLVQPAFLAVKTCYLEII